MGRFRPTLRGIRPLRRFSESLMVDGGPLAARKRPGDIGPMTMRAATEQQQIRSATHHVRVSKAFFRALCLAISELSMKTQDLYSFRRLLIYVLAGSTSAIYQIDRAVLDALCDADKVNGDIRLAVRIDSRHNDLLREFREHAEAELGRPVSVAEAMRVCIYAVTGK